MKLAILAIAAVLAAPGTALATNPVGSPPPPPGLPKLFVTSSKASPTTISLSRANGLTSCTNLSFKLRTTTPRRVIVVVHKVGTSSLHPITVRRAKAGIHVAKWCGKISGGIRHRSGAYTWYPCVGPTNVHRGRNEITCKARAPKRWLTVVK